MPFGASRDWLTQEMTELCEAVESRNEVQTVGHHDALTEELDRLLSISADQSKPGLATGSYNAERIGLDVQKVRALRASVWRAWPDGELPLNSERSASELRRSLSEWSGS